MRKLHRVLGLVVVLGSVIQPAISAEDPAEQLMSGQAWAEFADNIKALGEIVQSADAPATPLERAEGYRYLLAQLAEQIDVALYRSDLNDPLLRYNITKFRSMAMPSSDARYLRAEVEDSGIYRLWGQLGNAKGNTSIQFYSGVNSSDSWNLRDFSDAEGGFDIQIGGEPREQNWVRIPEGASMMFVREYFSDWDTERRSEFKLDRLNREYHSESLNPAQMAEILYQVTAVPAQQIPFFMKSLVQYRSQLKNKVMPAQPMNDVGLKENLYGPGWFDLQPDEALVLTVDASEAVYWSVQLGNFWGEAIDFVNFASSITGDQARLASDGKYHLVIASQDPGVPNWIDSAGHLEGFIFTRFQGLPQSPPQTVTLTKLDQLHEVLPADTPTVTHAERVAELRRRQNHMVRRWAP